MTKLTYHTATLHWEVQPSTIELIFNGTYKVLLEEEGDSGNQSSSLNASALSRNFSVAITTAAAGDDNAIVEYRMDLFGLKQGTSYVASFTVVTNIGTLEDIAFAHFRTLEYSKFTY